MAAEPEIAGYWGPITANIDWCETNYEYTIYIAEFWNTMTNFSLAFLSLFGAYEGWRGRQVEFYYILPFLSMMCVGFGSVFFHGSLLYRMQLLDELPMIWGTASILYAVQGLPSPHRKYNWPLAIFLLAVCFTTTYTYIILDNRLIFEIVYGVMVAYSITLLGFRTYRIDRGAIYLFFLAVFFYAAAFAFWLVDRFHCDTLQYARRNVLHPVFKPFSQFHAVWHIFVGWGGHSFLLVILRTRFSSLAKPHEFGRRFHLLPVYRYGRLRELEEGTLDDVKKAHKH